jgi:DNA-binding NarL/FixJ family response regulator
MAAAGHRRDGAQKTAETASALTSQEAQIARLAAEGHSNPEIGAQELRTGLATLNQAGPRS